MTASAEMNTQEQIAAAIEGMEVPAPHTNSWQLGYMRARKDAAKLVRDAAAPQPMQPREIPSGFTLISDRHFNALAEGLAEIKATNDGKSDQPIGDILTYVLDEIAASTPSPIQGTALVADDRTALMARIAELEKERDALVEALSPSASTKAAYIGEFHESIEMPNPEWDVDDDEPEYVTHKLTVSWDTIKAVMAAIRARAALAGAQS